MARITDPTRSVDGRPWHRQPAERRAAAVVAKIDQLARDQSYRRQLTKLRLGTYLGRRITSLTADIYHQRDEVVQQSYAMSVCDTAQANIAAKQRPKAQVLTKGGDYYLQLEAEKASKYMEGCLWAEQPGYANSWEQGEHVFHDSTWSEAGCVYVHGDVDCSSPVHERVFAHDIYVDPDDSRAGAPLVLNHAHLISKDYLIDRFPEHGRQIESSGVAQMHMEEVGQRASLDLCTIYKSWHRKKRVLFAVNGNGGTALLDEEYEHDRFPFVFIRWQRNALGFWGSPPVDQIRVNQDYANDILASIIKNTRTNAEGYVDVEVDSYEDSDLEEASKSGIKVLKRNVGKPPANLVMPNPFNPLTFDTFQSLKAACYELSGYSEMSTQGRKEQSITSGVAIRTVNDMQDERHLVRARAYEQYYVELGKLDLQVVQDIIKAGGKPSSVVRSEGFIDSIDWKEIDLKSDQFEVTIQASSTTEDTIAARRQTIEDLTRMGYLSPEVSEQVLTAPNPDVESLTKRESAQRRLMDKIVAKFSRYNSKKDKRGDIYESPDPLLKLIDAVSQMTDGYMVAREREAPEDVLQLYRDYITEAGAMLKPPAAAPSPPAPSMGAPPMPPGPMPGGPAPQLRAV